MRRLLFLLVGVLVAGVAALLVLGGALLTDGLLLQTGTSVAVAGVLAFVEAMSESNGYGPLLGPAMRLLWWTVTLTCFVPVLLIAGMGEVARMRALAFYAGGTGALTAAVPTLARAFASTVPAGAPGAVESRLALALFLAGLAAGTVYWAVAARHDDLPAPTRLD